MRCKKAKRMEAEKMALNLSNIPIVIFIKIQGLEVQVNLPFTFVQSSTNHRATDQSPLPSPRTTKTEVNGDTPATRTSVSVANNLRFSSKFPRHFLNDPSNKQLQVRMPRGPPPCLIHRCISSTIKTFILPAPPPLVTRTSKSWPFSPVNRMRVR